MNIAAICIAGMGDKGDELPQSGFLRLPREIRDMIYESVFRNTRISHGRIEALYHTARRLPDPFALSLLKVCRRVHAEIGETWLGMVLFHFEEVETLMDKISAIPAKVRSKICHVRVRASDVVLRRAGAPMRNIFGLVPAFKHLPGLQLKTLTILSERDTVYGPKGNFNTMCRLNEYGAGWQELRYVLSNSRNFRCLESLSLSNALQYIQDSTYPKTSGFVMKEQRRAGLLLEERDGSQSQSSVSMYQSTIPLQTGLLLKEAERISSLHEPPRTNEKL